MSNAVSTAMARRDEADTAPSGPPKVKSVEKAFTVLDAFRGRERYMALGEIAQAASLDKSAVQRLTRTLCAIGYLEQDPATPATIAWAFGSSISATSTCAPTG